MELQEDLACRGEEEVLERDELVIALRATEPILVARMERVMRQVAADFKMGRLTPEVILALRADYEAARSLLANLNEAVGGSNG